MPIAISKLEWQTSLARVLYVHDICCV